MWAFDHTNLVSSTASTRGSHAKYRGQRGKLEKAQFTVENCRAHFHWWKELTRRARKNRMMDRTGQVG
ncbi:hypothetical protein SNOG_03489 [Parastagonospora nodorum SN15]|uniref:Uncharacterized protein n=1 Tax=Phaeosphaeria nodorum (strain SN15 / ATCC MYA-4574 / FGSC 10173) TaxID=321614 RepID=Q0UXM5_PHANO|nr:hypothetical protein SNOG_03489 [Parastagonospora nodorum SN15]EAT88694.1 hypothetical protein SNOG_03489 [Parastagonospora nodorum SN15]